jgi:hypothetical protein
MKAAFPPCWWTFFPMASLSSEHLAAVAIVRVAARHHPLASFKEMIPKSELARGCRPVCLGQ